MKVNGNRYSVLFHHFIPLGPPPSGTHLTETTTRKSYLTRFYANFIIKIYFSIKIKFSRENAILRDAVVFSGFGVGGVVVRWLISTISNDNNNHPTHIQMTFMVRAIPHRDRTYPMTLMGLFQSILVGIVKCKSFSFYYFNRAFVSILNVIQLSLEPKRKTHTHEKQSNTPSAERYCHPVCCGVDLDVLDVLVW